MRILYFVDSLNIAGAEMLLMEMIQNYKHDHQLGVAYFTHGPLYDEIKAQGIPVYRLSEKGLKDPRAFIKSWQVIREFKPDIVHTHLSKSDIVGQLTARLSNVPVRIVTWHNTDAWRKKDTLSAIMKILVSGAHQMVAVSEVVADYHVKHGNYARERITVINNGIDLNRFNLKTVKPLDKTSLWNIPANQQTIGIIARLEPQKAHHILIDAARIIVDENPNVHIVIVGKGTLRDEIELQVEKLGLGNHITFAGIVREIPEFLAMIDIITFSSDFEGLPIALLESMAMARPVVSTQVGGIPKVIKHKENGILVPPSDPKALARELLALLNDKTLQHKLGQNALETIQETYSSQNMHTMILNLYHQLYKNTQLQ